MNTQNSILTELLDFFLNPNVTEYAVAAVFSQTFYPVIMAFVKNIIFPLLSIMFLKLDTSNLTFTISDTEIFYGEFIGNFIIFIISMLTLFFIFVKPFSNITTKKEIEDKKEEAKRQKRFDTVISSMQNIENVMIAKQEHKDLIQPI